LQAVLALDQLKMLLVELLQTVELIVSRTVTLVLILEKIEEYYPLAIQLEVE
jgi:hypothetical protein